MCSILERTVSILEAHFENWLILILKLLCCHESPDAFHQNIIKLINLSFYLRFIFNLYFFFYSICSSICYYIFFLNKLLFTEINCRCFFRTLNLKVIMNILNRYDFYNYNKVDYKYIFCFSGVIFLIFFM